MHGSFTSDSKETHHRSLPNGSGK